MSCPRSSNPFRQWSRLYRRAPSSSTASSNAYTFDHRYHHNKNKSPNTTRPFHSTSSYNAARSPAARRSQAQRSRPVYSSDALFNLPAQGDLEARLKFLESYGPVVWSQAINGNMLDRSVTQETFMDVAKRLLEGAYKQSPSGVAIREISPDVDLAFTIGHLVSAGNVTFREWVLTSSTIAGARIPTLITASRYLKQTDGSAPVRTATLDKLESLAMRERDPRAMVLHATVLGRRGRYAEAIGLMEQVMQMIYPSKIALSGDNNFMIEGIEPPWKVFAWLKEKAGDAAAKDEILQVAALEYQDPQALASYAPVMMQKGDLGMYEECMSKAATAGNAEACRKLANFYYLTSHGRYPRRGAKEMAAISTTPATVKVSPTSSSTEETGKQSKLSVFFTSLLRPQSHKEYRKLAMEWYELAFNHGSHQAALILSMLLRADGDLTRGLHFLQSVEKSPKLSSQVKQIKDNWDDENYQPEIPAHLLDV